MKKSQRRKLVKILLLLVFSAAVLWFFASPRHTPHKAESVQVRVEQPMPLPPLPPMPPADADKGQTLGEEGGNAGNPQPEPAPVPDNQPRPHGQPRIAIIIDDVGLDVKGSQRAVDLPPFITLSFMPYASRLREQTADARDQGHELMLHMPMEPLAHLDPGPGALMVGLPPDEIRQRFDTALASFVGFDGVNNHMGSKFTADTEGMQIVADELKPRGLFFLDSRTSPQTVGEVIARAHGVPTISRDIFLDDDQSSSAVVKQLEQTERVALRKGYAVAIGHPHAATLDALQAWIPEAEKQGFTLVPVHDLIKGFNPSNAQR